MGKKYLTNNPLQTKKLGKFLAKKILKEKLKKEAQVLALEGDLGGGKTTFLQGFAKGLGIKEKILSPTFIIMRKFGIEGRKLNVEGRKTTFNTRPSTFYHIDCYRIEKPKEILDLGFREIITNPQNIVAVEWADRIRKIMPQNAIRIVFEFINKDKREITIKVWRRKNV